MADEKGIKKVGEVTVEVDGEEVEIAPGAVQSVTTEVPSEADASSAPGPYTEDGEPLDVNRPPVSTNDPETPIAHSLVGGAGAPSGEPEIHPETHVAENAYVTAADKPNIDKEHAEAQKVYANEKPAASKTASESK
jgi:hypothetical protein